jgi:hypothetical protein
MAKDIEKWRYVLADLQAAVDSALAQYSATELREAAAHATQPFEKILLANADYAENVEGRK